MNSARASYTQSFVLVTRMKGVPSIGLAVPIVRCLRPRNERSNEHRRAVRVLRRCRVEYSCSLQCAEILKLVQKPDLQRFQVRPATARCEGLADACLMQHLHS